MQDKQRQRVWFGRTDMQEMDILPVNFGDELWKLVQASLLRAPIVACAPIIDQFSSGRRPVHRDSSP